MGWKSFFGYIVTIFLIMILFFYWYFPLKTIYFGTSSSGNSNFSLNSSGNDSMQFYSNLRYREPNISYNIIDCPLKKTDEMKTAFTMIQNLTQLKFYSVNQNEEISVTCNSTSRVSEGLFIAGEGGPTNITTSGGFNVIYRGSILLIKESDCEIPNIAIHELFHALGFDHSKNPNNVMYPVSQCGQRIGNDTINTIKQLYSFPSLPDLILENVSATMDGRYLNANLTVRNVGLKDAPGGTMEIYADGKMVQSIKFNPLAIGYGRKILINNIFIFQKSIGELRFFIKTDFDELSKQNNEVILNYIS